MLRPASVLRRAKAAVGKGALVDQSHIGADQRAIAGVQDVLDDRKRKLGQPSGHHRGKNRQDNGTTGYGCGQITTGPE